MALAALRNEGRRILASSTTSNPAIMVRRMSEAPFVPRERLIKKQQYFQNIKKDTYLKGPYDKVTSVAIPIILAGSCLFLIGRGIYNMSNGLGKKQ